MELETLEAIQQVMDKVQLVVTQQALQEHKNIHQTTTKNSSDKYKLDMYMLHIL